MVDLSVEVATWEMRREVEWRANYKVRAAAVINGAGRRQESQTTGHAEMIVYRGTQGKGPTPRGKKRQKILPTKSKFHKFFWKVWIRHQPSS